MTKYFNYLRMASVDETTIVTIKGVPVGLWRRAKAAAAERGVSVLQFVVDALTLALDGKKRNAA